MLHAIVCEVNYATRSGEIVVKKLLCDKNTPKGKTCALKSADKDSKLLDKAQRVWYTDKKEQRTSVRFCHFKNSSRSSVRVRLPAYKENSVDTTSAEFFVAPFVNDHPWSAQGTFCFKLPKVSYPLCHSGIP